MSDLISMNSRVSERAMAAFIRLTIVACIVAFVVGFVIGTRLHG